MASGSERQGIDIGLHGVIVAVETHQPKVLTIKEGGKDLHLSLPFGSFEPYQHRTMELGLRESVKQQTGLDLGYVEQLYTFGDRGRIANLIEGHAAMVSTGYLALTRVTKVKAKDAFWQDWYKMFPWEDRREGEPAMLTKEIIPRLKAWASGSEKSRNFLQPLTARERLAVCFGLHGGRWDDEKVLERYELLYEAGLVKEAYNDGLESANLWPDVQRDNYRSFGQSMIIDHRRILATAIGRLRAKIKYRPIIFELMTSSFTLFDLQKNVEAISGAKLHKQNFRRLVEKGGLVEPTGRMKSETGGRPAKLYRFRKDVLLERPSPGVLVKRAM